MSRLSLTRRLALAAAGILIASALSATLGGTAADAATSIATGPIGSGIGGACLDVLHSTDADGTPVQIHTCNGTGAQQWTVAADGTLHAFTRCLDVSNSGTANGAHVQVWTCNGSGAQQWVYNDATKTLVNPESGRCLDDPGSASDTQLRLWDCAGTANQQWALPATPISSVGIAGKCVDVAGGGTGNGTKVQLYTCDGSTAQQWTFATDGSVQALGKCLDVTSSGTSNGTKVQLYTCNGTAAQRWIHDPVTNALSNPQSAKCLDDPGSATTDGTQLQIWHCNGTAAQQWSVPTRVNVTVPRPDHVVVLIEENKAATQIIGSADAPYLTSLANSGAYFSRSYAIAHPSEPNYIALFSGSTQGLTDDSCPHSYPGVENLGTQVLGAGLTFTGYSESLPSAGYTGCASGRYVSRHCPWVSFPDVPASDNLPFGEFPTDFSQLPALSFVIPNLDDDMHDGTIAQGDTWARDNIDAYAQWARTHNSLLIVTFDEDDGTTVNQIPTFVVGQHVRAGTYAEQINHYGVLRTVEDMFDLYPIVNAAAVPAVTDIWQ